MRLVIWDAIVVIMTSSLCELPYLGLIEWEHRDNSGSLLNRMRLNKVIFLYICVELIFLLLNSNTSSNYINPSYGLSLVDTLWNASSYRQPLEQEGNPMT